jgi:hypothetical protein
MWTKAELFSLIAGRERKADASAKSAPRGKPAPGSQEWFKSLPPPRKDGISMNEIARAASAEKPKPPRRPGMQSRRFNGYWWHH